MHSPRHARRRRSRQAGHRPGQLAVLVVLLGLVLAACNGAADTTELTTEPDDTLAAEETDEPEADSEEAPEAEPGESVTVSIADHLPEGHVGSEQGAKFFMDRVVELTGGQVEFEYFPSGQMGSAGDMLTLVEAGTVDIGLVSPTHFDARMPLSGIFALPGLFTSAEQATAAYLEVLEEDGSPLRQVDFENNDLVPLVHVVLDPYQVTSVFPVQSVNDLAGRLVRSGTAAQEILLQQIGASPVSITGPETYEALERGTLEATLFAIGTIRSYALNEVAQYNTVNAPTGAAILGYSMRRSAFDDLPPNVQDAFLQAATEASENLSRAFDEESRQGIDELEGLEWYEFDEEELREWEEASRPVWDEWTSQLEAQGHPASEVLERILAIIG
jgi:TRAP-type C4-dicarboxylate transport system substrate-binding protein